MMSYQVRKVISMTRIRVQDVTLVSILNGYVVGVITEL